MIPNCERKGKGENQQKTNRINRLITGKTGQNKTDQKNGQGINYRRIDKDLLDEGEWRWFGHGDSFDVRRFCDSKVNQTSILYINSRNFARLFCKFSEEFQNFKEW